MLEQSFGLLFYLKKPKNYQTGPMPIYLRITVDGVPKEMSTSRECDPDRWSPEAERISGTKEDAKSVNLYLDTLKTKVYEIKRRLMEKEEPITAEGIKATLKGTSSKSKMAMVIFQEHNEQMKKLVGIDFSEGTMERYETSYRHTRDFMLWKYGVTDMELRKLDFEFVSQYEFWLKTVRACNHNTTMKYISNFRKIVNSCIKKGFIDKDPFVAFKMSKKEVIPVFLSESEVHKISKKKFASERISQVRDIFLFCCYTGLAFGDVKKLKASEIGIGIDGSKWIFTQRKKKGIPFKVPLLPFALNILNQYKAHPACINADRLLPVLSNQKYNEYLKEIANLCGIHKNLTTHTARHTFATTVTLTNGVPIESVSKMLGHKNLRTTQHYAKVIDRKLSDDMIALKHKLRVNGNRKVSSSS